MKILRDVLISAWILVLWSTGHGATVASAVSGWFDIGTEGSSQFVASPSALCPGGTVVYESGLEVTCGNNGDLWRVYGVLAFACPVNYLPKGYPGNHWESTLTASSGYGIAPEGYVPLGVGWGGTDSCYSTLPDEKAQLSLVGPPTTKPLGTSGHADASVIAMVSKSGRPLPGVQLSLTVEVKPYSGGHEHHDVNRPKGNLSIDAGTTDANGEVKFTFRPSEFAGIHTVKANCSSCANQTTTKDIQVKVPDLLPISPNPPQNADGSFVYALTSVDKTHQGKGRYHHNQYYLTASAREILRTLIDSFVSEGWGTVALNDASLLWGGRYDINANWSGSHAGHREGREIDISFARAQNQVSPSKRNDFYDKFCKSKKVSFPFSILHHYVLNPHFHVYLEKQTACWKSEK